MAKEEDTKEEATKEEATKKEKGEPRALTRLRPARGLGRVRSEMDRLFDEFMGTGWPSPLRRWPWLLGGWPFGEREGAAPALDVYEDKDAVVVKAELPGMEKDEVHVDISGDVVTLRGEKKKDEEIAEEDYYCCERAQGAFSRRIRLPVEVEAEKASATFKNGVLEMRLPKSEAAKRRSIPIEVK